MARTQSPIRLVLTEDQSLVLSEHGECFLLAAVGSYSDAANRFVIHAVPADRKQIEDAIRVAKGEARAVKPSATKP